MILSGIGGAKVNLPTSMNGPVRFISVAILTKPLGGSTPCLQLPINIAEAVEKSVIDPDFRKLALSDPQAAIRAIANKELPEGYQIKFVDCDPVADMTFLLPPAQCEELNEEQMAGIAGGGYWPGGDVDFFYNT